MHWGENRIKRNDFFQFFSVTLRLSMGEHCKKRLLWKIRNIKGAFKIRKNFAKKTVFKFVLITA